MEIGSQQSLDLLVSRLTNAATDPSAAQFREEIGGPQAPLTLGDTHANLHLALSQSTSWRTSVLCRDCEGGWLNGPYLCGFLLHGHLASGKRGLDFQHGREGWNNHSYNIPAQYLRRGTTKINVQGVLHLLHSLNHGFNAIFPDTAKQFLVSFLQLVPGGSESSSNVSDYYNRCAAFMTQPENLGSPPSYLDLFKDTRIKKSWVLADTYPEHIVIIDAPNMLRVWPDLMEETWDASNSYRDALSTWQKLQSGVIEYHTCLNNNPGRFVQRLLK